MEPREFAFYTCVVFFGCEKCGGNEWQEDVEQYYDEPTYAQEEGFQTDEQYEQYYDKQTYTQEDRWQTDEQYGWKEFKDVDNLTYAIQNSEGDGKTDGVGCGGDSDKGPTERHGVLWWKVLQTLRSWSRRFANSLRPRNRDVQNS